MNHVDFIPIYFLHSGHKTKMLGEDFVPLRMQIKQILMPLKCFLNRIVWIVHEADSMCFVTIVKIPNDIYLSDFL